MAEAWLPTTAPCRRFARCQWPMRTVPLVRRCFNFPTAMQLEIDNDGDLVVARRPSPNSVRAWRHRMPAGGYQPEWG